MPNDPLHSALESHAARRRLILGIQVLVLPVLFGAGIAGSLLIPLRFLWEIPIWLGFVLGALGIVIGVIVGTRSWPKRQALWRTAGHVESGSNSQGLIAALADSSDPQWTHQVQAHLNTVSLPGFPWKNFGILALAPVWIALTVLLPLGNLREENLVKTATPSLARIAERLEELQKQEHIAPDEAQNISEQLRRLAEAEKEYGMDQERWHALDSLASAVEEAAKDAERRKQEAQALAQALSATALKGAEEMQAILREMSTLAKEHPESIPDLSLGNLENAQAWNQALEQAVQASALDPAMAEALRKAAKLPPQTGTPSGKPGDPAALREAALCLGQRCKGGSCSASEAAIVALCPRPGSGGVDRGPGTAPITKEERDRLEGGSKQDLTRSTVVQPDGSVVLAVSSRDPKVDAAKLEAAAEAEARSYDPAKADAQKPEVAPRHRAVVEGYFQK